MCFVNWYIMGSYEIKIKALNRQSCYKHALLFSTFIRANSIMSATQQLIYVTKGSNSEMQPVAFIDWLFITTFKMQDGFKVVDVVMLFLHE